jgi:K(+)-stimulated pyrophosphate-energized sodium pump
MNILIKLMSIVSLVIAPHLNHKMAEKGMAKMNHPVKHEVVMQVKATPVVKAD